MTRETATGQQPTSNIDDADPSLDPGIDLDAGVGRGFVFES
jgi:hypothetical protein